MTKAELDEAFELWVFYSGYFSEDRQATIHQLFADGYTKIGETVPKGRPY